MGLDTGTRPVWNVVEGWGMGVVSLRGSIGVAWGRRRTSSHTTLVLTHEGDRHGGQERQEEELTTQGHGCWKQKGVYR